MKELKNREELVEQLTEMLMDFAKGCNQFALKEIKKGDNQNG